MKFSANSRVWLLTPLPVLASAVSLFAAPTARCADELCAYWPLDENSGTVVPNDSSTADATINSGAAWVAGTINNALSFNGVNQYVTGAVTVPLTNTAVSMWFRTTQSGGGLYCATNANRTTYDRDIYLNGGNIHSRIWNVEVISSTGKNYADGEWHQVVHTFGSIVGGQKLYVDGVLVASGTKSASVFNTQTHVQIGYAISSPTMFFNGQLDDVRIWNRALTAPEALALAQRSGTANYPNPPLASIIGSANLKLDWLAPTGATSHDIYLGDSPDIANSTPASDDFMGNFTIKPLDVLDTTPGYYYWRVDERLDTTVFKGPTWSFRFLDGDGSNSINLTQPTSWWVGANESFVQSGVLSGSSAFYKDGPGALVLTGNNIYTGGTIIRDGILQIGDGGTSGSLGSGPVTVNSTLIFDRSDNVTFASSLSGPGNLIQQGTGSLTLAGANTYTGLTTINGGRLIVTGKLGNTSSANVATGATLEFNSGSYNSSGSFWSGGLTGSGTVEINYGLSSSTQMQRFRGDNTAFAGTFRLLSGKRISLENVNSASANGAWIVDPNGFLSTAVANGIFEFGSLSGSGTLGAGGGVTGQTYRIGALNTDTTFAGVINSAVKLEKVGTGTLVLTGNNTHSGGSIIRDGILQIGDGGTSGSLGSGPVTLDSTLVFNSSGNIAISSIINGFGNVIQQGPGTLTLSGVNTYTGTTTINGGRLNVTGKLGNTSNANVATGSTLEFNSGSYNSSGSFWSGGLTGSGTVEINFGLSTSSQMQRFRGDNTAFAGTVRLLSGKRISLENVNSASANGAWIVDPAGFLSTAVTNGTFEFGSLSGSGTLGAGGGVTGQTYRIGALNTDTTFAGVINSAVKFEKVGTGALTLSGANTYTGLTTISAGTLNVMGSLANTTTTIAAAGTLGGTGTLAGAVTNNGTLAPGNNAVGNLTVNNTLNLSPGSGIDWQIANWTGAAGTGWDNLTANSLNLTASSANPVVLRLSQSALTNFTESSQTFTLVQTTSGITGFAANKFVIDASAMTNPQGTWVVQQSSNNLVLTYTHHNVAPVFDTDPMTLIAIENSPFSGQLAATDPNVGDTLVFTKISGPDWLTVSNSGVLSGTPASGDLGSNAFVVRVTDADGAFDEAALNITVAMGTGNPDGDFDGDGLTNGEEAVLGTDPTNIDTDGDGIPDNIDGNQLVVDRTDFTASSLLVISPLN